MPHVNTVNEDDDNYSLSTSTNSDDDCDNEFNCYNHRSCSRYASCNKNKHQHSSTDSIISSKILKDSKPIKGDIRSVNNEPGHRQKYDGNKWRRICSYTDCLLFLHGGIFYDNWLCRKHYLLAKASKKSGESDNSTTKNRKTKKLTKKKLQNLSTRQTNKKSEQPKRGDIMINSDGIRQKYDGRSWRSVCNFDNCISFIVRHGYCHRHDMETRKKTTENLQENLTSTISKIPQSNTKKPKKGDIQHIRQQWNGTKWYSLCNYHTGDCTRRSAGIKYAYLCDKHYKEHKNQQKNSNLINNNKQILSSSSKIKQKKLINNNDDILLSDMVDQQNIVTPNQSKSIEQCIQTDVTYPIDSIDLRQGCILIQDDSNDDEYQSESPQLMVYIKKEEEDYLNNRRRLPMDVDSLPINCKLELTKLEI